MIVRDVGTVPPPGGGGELDGRVRTIATTVTPVATAPITAAHSAALIPDQPDVILMVVGWSTPDELNELEEADGWSW